MRPNVDDYNELMGKTQVKKPQQQNKNMKQDGKTVPEKKKVKGGAVAAIVIVVLIALFGVSYYYNLMDTKTKIIQFFINQDDTYTKAMASQQALSDSIAQQQTDIESRSKELDQRSADLDTREQAVGDKESAAADRQTADEQKKAETAKMVTIYEGMDAAVASGILSNYTDKQWIADLLMQMNEKKAAAIMAAMDPQLAASITALMVPK
jgi:flagellar motility protein MotE (MotC chaperone)